MRREGLHHADIAKLMVLALLGPLLSAFVKEGGIGVVFDFPSLIASYAGWKCRREGVVNDYFSVPECNAMPSVPGPPFGLMKLGHGRSVVDLDESFGYMPCRCEVIQAGE